MLLLFATLLSNYVEKKTDNLQLAGCLILPAVEGVYGRVLIGSFRLNEPLQCVPWQIRRNLYGIHQSIMCLDYGKEVENFGLYYLHLTLSSLEELIEEFHFLLQSI